MHARRVIGLIVLLAGYAYATVALLGCDTEKREHTDEPVLEIRRHGGWDKGASRTLVWSDGRVIYTGPQCHFRESVPRDRVTSLVAEVVLAGTLDRESDPGCPQIRDAPVADLTIRLNELTVTWWKLPFGCPWLDNVRAAIERVVGPNPCI